MSKRNNRQVEPAIVANEEAVIEPVMEPTVETVVPAMTRGIVDGCYMLNIRQTPSLTANVLDIIASGSEVEIELTESTDDFYKICTASGCEGYCSKEYIKVVE